MHLYHMYCISILHFKDILGFLLGILKWQDSLGLLSLLRVDEVVDHTMHVHLT